MIRRAPVQPVGWPRAIAPNTPVVKYAPGEKTLLVKGAQVMITGAQRQPDGSYNATSVRAETNGVKPPL